MENQQHHNRRRSQPRYLAKDRALALVSSPPTTTPYHIIDISKGGLAFRYLGEKMESEDISKLDLYFNDALCVKELPVTSVGDCWTGSDLTDIRRNCLAFSDLTDEQLTALESFIKAYTHTPPH